MFSGKLRTLLMLIWISSSHMRPLSCTTLSMSPREYIAHGEGSAASASRVHGAAHSHAAGVDGSPLFGSTSSSQKGHLNSCMQL